MERFVRQHAFTRRVVLAGGLAAVTAVPGLVMEWYADESYRRFRDPATGLYRFAGANPVTLLEQSGMIRIEAMLAWSPRDYPKLT
jgi:hypothetical protein